MYPFHIIGGSVVTYCNPLEILHFEIIYKFEVLSLFAHEIKNNTSNIPAIFLTHPLPPLIWPLRFIPIKLGLSLVLTIEYCISNGILTSILS